MKNTIFIRLAVCSVFIFSACSNEPLSTNSIESANSVSLLAGATQISGVGYYADIADCDYVAEGADFALAITGDLEGCLYVYVEDYGCSPSGTYRESGREYFVGTYNGESGSFWTNYRFEAKFEGCEDGFFVGAEIFGRCQHPIQEDSGTGVFEGVSGRLDFKDEVDTGSFPYKGHFRY